MTLLEDDVTDLQDEVEEMETDINQLDNGLLIVEENVPGNIDDIDGKAFVSFKIHVNTFFISRKETDVTRKMS